MSNNTYPSKIFTNNHNYEKRIKKELIERESVCSDQNNCQQLSTLCANMLTNTDKRKFMGVKMRRRYQVLSIY